MAAGSSLVSPPRLLSLCYDRQLILYIEPVFLFSIIVLTISTVFTTFILTGSTAPGLRKFYLISLRYNTDSGATKLIGKLDGLFSSDKGKVTFSNIRVGYRGLCIEHSEGWDCARNGAAIGHAAGDVSGDPLDLVAIADIYRDKISFAFPVWVAVVSLGIAWVCVALNCIPGIPIPAWTKKIAAAGCTLGSLALLGAMVLQQVTSYVPSLSSTTEPVLIRQIVAPFPPLLTKWAWMPSKSILEPQILVLAGLRSGSQCSPQSVLPLLSSPTGVSQQLRRRSWLRAKKRWERPPVADTRLMISEAMWRTIQRCLQPHSPHWEPLV